MDFGNNGRCFLCLDMLRNVVKMWCKEEVRGELIRWKFYVCEGNDY